MDLLINPSTSAQIDSFAENPSHSLIIGGPFGAGKPSLTKLIIGRVINSPLSTAPYFLHITSDNHTISIAAIRRVRTFLNLKTTGKTAIRRAVLIEDADTMTTEAQNALLKILEEPPEDTIIVLTVTRPNKLLPTVYSRCQVLSVSPIDLESATNYFKSPASDVTKAFHISGGQPGLMSSILDSSVEHDLKTAINTAKKLVAEPLFERLTNVENLSKDKDALPTLVYALKRIYRAILEQSAAKNNEKELKQAHNALKALAEAEQNLSYNVSPKLLLTDLLAQL